MTKLKFQLNIEVKENENVYDYEKNEIIYGNNNDILFSIDDLKNNYNDNDINFENESEKIIYKNYLKLLDFLNDIENYIEKSKIINNYSEIFFELKKENKINNSNNKDFFYITCNYEFVTEFKDKENKDKTIRKKFLFKDENILVNSIDSKFQGFIYLINELSNEDYKTINKQKKNIFLN